MTTRNFDPARSIQMYHFQTEVLRWVSHQPGITGLVIFFVGLVFAFSGHKFFAGLLGVACAGIGWLLGYVAGHYINEAQQFLPAILAVLCGIMGLLWRKLGVLLVASGTGGILGLYFSDQLGFSSLMIIAMTIVGAGLATIYSFLSPRSAPVIVTTILGTMMLVIGFVGLSTTFLPSVGSSLRTYANSFSLLLPMLGGMVFIASYSYQSMHLRGDMETGV